MTLRIYADHKKLPLGRIGVDVSHAKIHVNDCADCTEAERSGSGRIDRFERVISIEGEVSEKLRGKIAEIADKCPVHRTLEAMATIRTIVK
ncbi:OsmC-like protein [Rhizobium azibense]|nr:OsmC-like protein [Rhizobium azibense]